jgi:hypothetical protein
MRSSGRSSLRGKCIVRGRIATGIRVTYSSSVGSAIHNVPPSNKVLMMNMEDILSAALKISLRELGGTPGERGNVAP